MIKSFDRKNVFGGSSPILQTWYGVRGIHYKSPIILTHVDNSQWQRFHFPRAKDNSAIDRKIICPNFSLHH